MKKKNAVFDMRIVVIGILAALIIVVMIFLVPGITDAAKKIFTGAKEPVKDKMNPDDAFIPGTTPVVILFPFILKKRTDKKSMG